MIELNKNQQRNQQEQKPYKICLIGEQNVGKTSIIPFSIILDNTINNKALVYVSENQRKGQQTPLMYMTPEQADG